MRYLKRVNFLLRTEGVRGFFERISNLVLFKMGLKKSETLFFCINLSDKLLCTPLEKHKILDDLEFKVIHDFNSFLCWKKIPAKLNYVPLKKWFERNSKCMALVLKKRIIAYAWVHENEYDNLGAAGIFSLKRHEVFIGPFYTDPEFRKMGLYYYLMQYCLNWLKQSSVAKVFGSSSISNIATIKVFTRSGFFVFGLVNAWRTNHQVLDFDLSISLANKIKR